MGKGTERISSEEALINPFFERHLVIYEFARKFVCGGAVLDVGCGEGHGSRLLSETAESVVGIDYAKDALEIARKSPGAGKLEFICADVTKFMPPDGAFDTICAFHIIEHLLKPDDFLRNMKRLLKPGGTLLLATPNKTMSIVENPYHYIEYDKGGFEILLRGHFSDVGMFGLHFSRKVDKFIAQKKKEHDRILRIDPLKLRNLMPVGLKRFISGFVAPYFHSAVYRKDPGLVDSITMNDFWISDSDVALGLDFIGVCKK